MLYAGLDLSRHKLDVHLLDESGSSVEVLAIPPDVGGLKLLVERVARHGEPVEAAIESMTGARFVHDTLERYGWTVQIADAAKTKGLAPLAAKTDKIDARVLAELARRDLVPAIWLPDPAVREARERARFRLFLVRWRTALKRRIHATLMTFGHPVPVSDLFGVRGRQLLASLAVPEPLSYTIAAEIGDISRFATPGRLVGYTGPCPRVYQSGATDRRGSLTKNGPTYLRWALIEAATTASRDPRFHTRYAHTKRRRGGR
jgi:transposase